MTKPSDKIIIVGAGVFGLSTALHLSKGGYTDVTVFDYQPYNDSLYDPEKGCDSASSDINKVYRCSYGTEVEYQDLAYSGRPIWEEWNKTIASTPADKLPKGLTPDTKVFEENGLLRLSEGKLSQYDLDSLKALEAAGYRDHQHHIGDSADYERLRSIDGPKTNWMKKLEPFAGLVDKTLDAYLDTSAGTTYADKACVWARHLCEKQGVKFVLGPEKGKLARLLIDGQGESKRAKGIETVDGLQHFADVVVVACGPWTPSILPDADQVLQATAGSVCQIKLPRSRPDLWKKYGPEQFPTWAYGLTGHKSPEFGGFYGFPRSKDGVIKIGYRGRKWINMQLSADSSSTVSTPMTKYTATKATNLPIKAIENLKRAIDRLFPDLSEIGITGTRMCWYTDSMDDSFVIDYVPGYDQTLFVASGGSGHGFKLLPVLGKHVKNALERQTDQFTPLWKWRTRSSPRVDDRESLDLSNLVIATEQDWKWAEAVEGSRSRPRL